MRLNQLKNQHGKPQKLVRSVKTAGQFQQVTNLWNEMIETVVPVVIAIITGTAVLFNKVNTRVTQLDNKVDKLELKVVESYTSKNDFTTAMIRMGDHLIRIEDKMDQLIAKKF
jgi:phage shock protein A